MLLAAERLRFVYQIAAVCGHLPQVVALQMPDWLMRSWSSGAITKDVTEDRGRPFLAETAGQKRVVPKLCMLSPLPLLGAAQFPLCPVNRFSPRCTYGSAALATQQVEEDETDAKATTSAVEEFRTKNQIHIESDGEHEVPAPIRNFRDARFPGPVQTILQRRGFNEPTLIQAQGWPIALQGRDLVAIASTGSGKTLGYLLPGLTKIFKEKLSPRNGPLMLVLAPTRELARQIQEEANKFGFPLRIHNVCLYGGASRGVQIRQVQQRPHVVIATPGRLLDLHEDGAINLGQVSYLVLDEADRMLDMGFEAQIRAIAVHLPSERQTLFFSATWPQEVRDIADKFARHQPMHVFLGNVQEKLVANRDIQQEVRVVRMDEKLDQLMTYLEGLPPRSLVIVFCDTKAECDWLGHQINSTSRMRCAVLHGDKTQGQRDRVLADFKAGRQPILVATDVAARGLDVPNVYAVINYDYPTESENYIHRIGRTGRAGHHGQSLTFFTKKDAAYAEDLIQVLKEADQTVPPELEQLARRAREDHMRKRQKRFGSQGGGRGGSNRFWGSGGGRGGGGGGGWGGWQDDSRAGGDGYGWRRGGGRSGEERIRGNPQGGRRHDRDQWSGGQRYGWGGDDRYDVPRSEHQRSSRQSTWDNPRS